MVPYQIIMLYKQNTKRGTPPRNPYLAKISFKSEDVIQTFSDKQKLKESVTSSPENP